jgi:hypothetical protein
VNYRERLDELRKELTDPGGRFEGDIADGDGTTCLSRQDTARDALAKYEAAKK